MITQWSSYSYSNDNVADIAGLQEIEEAESNTTNYVTFNNIMLIQFRYS